jgi:galactokinase
MSEGQIASIVTRANAAGRAAFGPAWAPDRRAVAPGRIELLGNHIDYNGGPVLAAAIDRQVVVLASPAPAGDDAMRAVAADVPELHPVSLVVSELRDWRNPAPAPGPYDYVRGVIAAIQARDQLTLRRPALLSFAGDVPIGFGLSSSAALCVSLGLALAEPAPPFAELVLLAQEAEHRAGTPCGTMDQAASIAGGVIELNTVTLEAHHLSPRLGDLVFAVADSGVDRSLGTSSYPARVEESKRALAHANRALGLELPNLAALTPEQLESLSSGPDPLPEPLRARARHVVTETERVRAGARAARAGDWAAFGRLMTASGRSSATDYEISHPRVEALVAATLAVEGVLGARMMGGGEGGTVLILLPRDLVPTLDASLRTTYYQDVGLADRPDLIHVCTFAAGARAEAIADGLPSSA